MLVFSTNKKKQKKKKKFKGMKADNKPRANVTELADQLFLYKPSAHVKVNFDCDPYGQGYMAIKGHVPVRGVFF